MTLNDIFASFIAYLPTLIAALIVLIIGWLVARWLGGIVTNILRRMGSDDRLNKMMDKGGQKPLPIASWIGNAVYYILLLIVLVAFFQILGLTLANAPIQQFLGVVASFIPSSSPELRSR